ncbi:hypothetical protein COV93_03145 [Candidatus Woesearchaeota archaeon CG11_big_fil_rev_8_21_14_0_20_43_8]|nr:MAG: hypothetical protein COV93_03145 [Candidatus Woesearchaeota archaeon CG11_big_fil_rev_8_21_14_0_20_43_8]PIO05148.1 MAG: hypothetical protein COT47_06070 [Candidatus Woesearchaeota archaeon CG08_land_8_20_14_0_20_43_7]
MIYEGIADAGSSLSDELSCRGTVGWRGTYSQQGTVTKTVLPNPPLLCKQQHLTLPLDKTASDPNKALMKDISDKMARCWWQFGEGLVDNPFLQSAFSEQQCFQCYSLSIDNDKIGVKEKVTGDDLIKYMNENSYIPYFTGDSCHNGAGHCSNDASCSSVKNYGLSPWISEKTTKCENKGDYCCYKKTACENHDGYCQVSAGVCPSGYREVTDYSCSSKEKCCIPKEKVDTYFDYIQFAKGQGAVMLKKSLVIDPKETYAIAFMGSKDNCGTWCKLLGGGGGAIAGLLSSFVVTPVGGAAVGITAGIAIKEYMSSNPTTQYVIFATQDELNKLCPMAE